MPKCELPIKFNNSDELIVLKNQEIIKKIPLLQRAMEIYNSNWDQEDTIITEPIDIPFKRESGDFIIASIDNYINVPSNDRPEDYPEANAKSLSELRDIIELSNYLECEPMVNICGLIIASKLSGQGIPAIADFFGVEYLEGEQSIFDPKDGWIRVDNVDKGKN